MPSSKSTPDLPSDAPSYGQREDSNGFVWHTTGSGKTLTSFQASTLHKENNHIHKYVFIVDHKDLVRRLLSEDYADKLLVTTNQKHGIELDETSKHNEFFAV
jgi:type I restriction enzyme, R subunit